MLHTNPCLMAVRIHKLHIPDAVNILSVVQSVSPLLLDRPLKQFWPAGVCCLLTTRDSVSRRMLTTAVSHTGFTRQRCDRPEARAHTHTHTTRITGEHQHEEQKRQQCSEVRSSTNEAVLSGIKIKTCEKTPVEKKEQCIFSIIDNVVGMLLVNRCSTENQTEIS